MTINPTHKVKETGPPRLRGKEFRKEFNIEEFLPDLAAQGNMAAYNAIRCDYPNVGKYELDFCYGKIGCFGYVVRNEDLEPLE